MTDVKGQLPQPSLPDSLPELGGQETPEGGDGTATTEGGNGAATTDPVRRESWVKDKHATKAEIGQVIDRFPDIPYDASDKCIESHSKIVIKYIDRVCGSDDASWGQKQAMARLVFEHFMGKDWVASLFFALALLAGVKRCASEWKGKLVLEHWKLG
ncbi:hypothetical protein TrRE_jg9560 [Triparma retinervis]|uniref:Uncharacterized protein n=1 Tax=Triparma retinervis TaxID=2557542 RepID=A0A9W7E349_9STRA|nr:hypothetical protein TrRE_jg9560 [Triparma retinervis]